MVGPNTIQVKGVAPTPLAPRRMSLSGVTRGRLQAPLRVVLYGVEGVGKSTFVASAPSPIILGSEEGTACLDVPRFPTPQTFSEALDAVRVLREESHEYQTLGVDTVDWLEPLCWAEVCATGKKESIEDFGFGKGYVAALELWRRFVAELDALRREKRMHVILLGHALVKTFKNPEGADYDRYGLKLHEKAAGFLKEWADEVLFANYQTFVDKEKAKDRKGKGVGGTRMMYAERTAAFDAKTRHGLPAELPLSYEEFAAAIARAHANDETVPELRARAAQQLEVLRALAPDIAAKAELALAKAGEDQSRLSTVLNTLNARIAEHSKQEE